MRKALSIITAGLVISLSGFDLELKEGWQNKGALEDINVTCFNNLSIESVWYYEKGIENWKVYFPNNPEFMDILPKDVQNLTFIPKGDGFWVIKCVLWARGQGLFLLKLRCGREKSLA